MITIQNRIKQIREYFGLSQEQFAQRINRSYALISLIETGRKKVSEETAERICSEFSVNKEWLLNGEGDMTASDPIDREKQNQADKKKSKAKSGRIRICCRFLQTEDKLHRKWKSFSFTRTD